MDDSPILTSFSNHIGAAHATNPIDFQQIRRFHSSGNRLWHIGPRRYAVGRINTVRPKMKLAILAALAMAASPELSAAPEASLVVAESGSPAIDQLVAALVSRRPAPLPMGGHLPGESPLAEIALLNRSGRCATDEVEGAFQKLKATSPKDYRFLLKHANDDRYSYSVIGPHGSPTMSGWMNFSVGQAVDEILSNGMHWVGGYKWREATGDKGFSPPTFSDYIEAQGGYEKWADSVSSMSRAQIDLKFLEWCVRLEEERGFKDDEQRTTVLERYKAKKEEVEQAAPSDGDKPSN